MTLDHKAIFKAYPSVVTIDDGRGAFDVNGNPVSLEQSNIDAARATLNTELSAVQYKNDRVGGVGIGRGENAALLTARIIGVSNKAIANSLEDYRKELEQKTLDSN